MKVLQMLNRLSGYWGKPHCGKNHSIGDLHNKKY